MSWIVSKGDRVRVPHVEGRADVATVVDVTMASGHPPRLGVMVIVDGCSCQEHFYFDELQPIEKEPSEALTLNQLAEFEGAALRLTLPLELAQHFEGVVEAARRDIMRRLAGATRLEYERQEAFDRSQRDRLAALTAIILRDAVVCAGGDDVMAAFDHAAVRALYMETVAPLVDSADLVLESDSTIADVSHDGLLDRIGRALISAAAVKVIDGARALIY